MNREYLRVAALTEQHWQRIEDKARAVLGSTAGLRASIAERERVVIYWDDRDELLGLVTLDMRHERFMGRDVVAIYTGNTWIAPHMRGKNLIQRLGFESFVRSSVRWPRAEKFWFFGSNSYKSYLALARNFRDYWPRPDRAIPAWESAYMLHLTRAIYHADVDPARMVYEAESARSFNEDETRVPEALTGDRDVRFFVDRNPHYAKGAKLMCLGPLTLANWSVLGRRSVARLVRRSR